MNYKQMLLLDVLINQSGTTRRRYLIFRMEQAICMGKFYKKKDLDGLVDAKRLYKDYVTFFNSDSEAVHDLFEYDHEIVDLEEDAESNEELRRALLDDAMIYHMATFTQKIDVMDYIKREDLSDIIYNIRIEHLSDIINNVRVELDDYVEYFVDEGTEFTPLMMTEKKRKMYHN